MVTSRHIKFSLAASLMGGALFSFPRLNLPRNRLRRKAY
jgi:hypothetical protein